MFEKTSYKKVNLSFYLFVGEGLILVAQGWGLKGQRRQPQKVLKVAMKH